jgi:hypothetical protein
MICKHCKEDKPPSAFYIYENSWCMACHRERRRKSRLSKRKFINIEAPVEVTGHIPKGWGYL